VQLKRWALKYGSSMILKGKDAKGGHERCTALNGLALEEKGSRLSPLKLDKTLRSAGNEKGGNGGGIGWGQG